ncbi:MAG: helix-turn-helix domain-containing protein [Rhodospirillales bacterium]
MAIAFSDGEHIGKFLQEKNIELETRDPVVAGGFTQVPNCILEDAELSIGAKVVYAMFLRYAWHNDHCFPGQETLAKHIGMSRTRVTEYVGELEKKGFITIKRRGLGKTNLYKIHFTIKKKA